MNRLPLAKRAQILSLLCEGSSMRSVSRLVDVSINTVTRELVLAGQACADFHDRTVRNVQSRRVQADEIWSFVEMKEKHAKQKAKRGLKRWRHVDMDGNRCRQQIDHFVVHRLARCGCGLEFMHDLANRLANRVQLTTDGHRAYLDAVIARSVTANRFRDAGEGLREAPESRNAIQPAGLHRRGA